MSGRASFLILLTVSLTLNLAASECGYNWPKEEVPFIITPEESAVWPLLHNDDERDQFVQQFWLRRDPTPDTVLNEYRNEYYRRIVYANDHFSSHATRGWKTDRGRIYEKYGAPDTVAPTTQNGAPIEVWTYRWMDDYQPAGSSQEPIQLKFVDACRCGAFQLEAAATDRAHLLGLLPPAREIVDQFEPGLQVYIGPVKTPQVRLKDLEEIVSHQVIYHQLPFDVALSFIHVTRHTVQVPIKLRLQSSKLKWIDGEKGSQSRVQVFIRWTTLTQRIVEIAEDEFVTSRIPGNEENTVSFTIPAYLTWGRYRLDVVIRDANADTFETWSHGVIVPDGGDGCGNPNF